MPLITLRRSSLDYLPDNGPRAVFQYPAHSVQNEEIIDREELFNSLKKFFSGLPDHRRPAIILLDESVVFQKELPLAGLDISFKEFLAEIPLNPEIISHTRRIKGDKVTVYATNSQLYLVVKSVLESLGGRVTSVLPAGLQPDLRPGGKPGNTSKDINFLTADKPRTGYNKYSLILLVILLLLAILILSGTLVYRQGSTRNAAPGAVLSPTPAVVEFKVRIVSNMPFNNQELIRRLSDSGIKNIYETGSESTISSPAVYFSPDYPESLHLDFISKLSDLLPGITPAATQPGEYDITIFTP